MPALIAAPVATAVPATSARISAGAKMGKLLSRVEPHYPDQARRMNVEGPVALTLEVGEDGKVRNVTVRSGNPLLVLAAKDAARRWRYEPSLLNGVPTPFTAEVVIKFSLSQQR